MSPAEHVRVGIVGPGFWADTMYLPAFANHPNATVVAICGRDEARTQAFAAEHGIPHYFADYEAMYASGLIDAVVIVTGNKTHYDMTMKALDVGLHVLCEKPLAMNVAEANAMAQKAEATGLKCLVPFTYRFMPAERYLKQLIDSGYIGKPYNLNMRYYTGYARQGDYMWRFDLEEAGAGAVGDIGSHFMYLSYWYYGEIESVMCQLSHHIERDPRPDGNNDYVRADDGAMILLQFKNGAQGVIVASAVLYEDTPFGQTHHKEFHGSEGTLYTFNDWDTIQEVKGARVGEGMIKPLPIPDEIWGGVRCDTVHNTYRDVFREQDYMARGWINDILHDTPSSPSFADAAYIQRVIAACQLSAKEDRRVMLDEI
ncbi:MAG: Gfo/Idh/MocA family oxidoreductase [Anaerolineaceae bacterium]|nr:Gfo/Idh/MocA family oxidoreductase [Anaerolineaceae bacterium]